MLQRSVSRGSRARVGRVSRPDFSLLTPTAGQASGLLTRPTFPLAAISPRYSAQGWDGCSWRYIGLGSTAPSCVDAVKRLRAGESRVAQPPIGIVLDSLGQPAKEAMQSAARLAFREVELPVVEGEVDPASLSRTGRRHLLHYVSGLGLRLAALGGDLGGTRFDDGAALERRLDKTRQIIELAAELNVPVVIRTSGGWTPSRCGVGMFSRPCARWLRWPIAPGRAWRWRRQAWTRRRWASCLQR